MSGVLLVEDDADMRVMLRMMLRALPGCEVLGEAVEAHEAIEAAERLSPSLIILDHSLEGDTSGLEAAPALRAAAPDARIVLFSAYDLHREVDAEPAVDAFVRKDSVHRLVPTILRLLAAA
jgi:two-component system, NarL family, nitrate/nitrite response regulator NarL